MNNLCNICPRNCNANRKTKLGFCGAPSAIKVAHVGLHFWEEPCISGTRGSGTVFFSHCNLRCVFCQNAELRDGKIGKEISTQHLVEVFKRLEKMGAHNINLVSPTHYSTQILDALKTYKPDIPVVWNSNGYETIETIKKVAPYVDVFLVDLKYYDSALSARLSFCPNYFEVASKTILEIRKIVGADIFENGLMKKGLIVRHLVLPNHTDDSLQIIDFLAEKMPNTIFSLMSQYVPYAEAKNFEDISRKLKPIEYNRVLHYAQSKMKGTIFAQDTASASEIFIPTWKPEEV